MTATEVGIGEGVPVSDERLAAALRAGDPQAIAEAFDRYADRVWTRRWRRCS